MASGRLAMLVGLVACLGACDDSSGGYTAAAALTRNGLARDASTLRALDGQAVRIRGYVDHANLYGDEDVRGILGEWWSGDSQSSGTWRFNMKSREADGPGQSFPVFVRNDGGRGALLEAIVGDARAGRSSQAFVTGTLRTFEAPLNAGQRTGLSLEVAGSSGVSLGGPPGD